MKQISTIDKIYPSYHIFYECSGYTHHGIYCGDVFYDNGLFKDAVIHFERNGINIVSYEEFAKNRIIKTIIYYAECYLQQGVATIERALYALQQSQQNKFLSNSDFACDSTLWGLSILESVHPFLPQSPFIPKYHVVHNNCEHFAFWCLTGYKHSSQVDNKTMIMSAVASLVNPLYSLPQVFKGVKNHFAGVYFIKENSETKLFIGNKNRNSEFFHDYWSNKTGLNKTGSSIVSVPMFFKSKESQKKYISENF